MTKRAGSFSRRIQQLEMNVYHIHNVVQENINALALIVEFLGEDFKAFVEKKNKEQEKQAAKEAQEESKEE